MTTAKGGDPLQALARQRPEWGSWLALLDAVRQEAADPGWAGAVPRPLDDRTPDAPLLGGTAATVDPGRVQRWVQRLLGTAAAHGGAAATLERARTLEPLALLGASVESDTARVEALAAAAGVEPAPLRAVASLVAMPLLHACARALGPAVPAAWRAGYCPVCGAWPALAEARGLERTRRLRCGRCGGDWHAEWLRCPFCDTGDHARLGALVPENSRETQRIETCTVCRGYLKALTTLAPRTPLEVALDDLETVALDAAALERGYARPTGAGRHLGMRLAARERRMRLAWRS